MGGFHSGLKGLGSGKDPGEGGLLDFAVIIEGLGGDIIAIIQTPMLSRLALVLRI